ncbi:hypothetical protein KP509_26G021200 [Ceratopteris richardii]|uniref:CWF19-like protein 2 n=1 Tax=Ceratopteris richardii TaxID=49495 RepID=A0A8T2RL04_CERRI|nr:hypothetical protein KP509_26G021200 [Ceratopteris richardii]KAH7296368.1 hypothetical protein KP509_26G021200 [Ceratopteris richardii]
MLKGIRLVSREEATSKSQRKDKNDRHSRRHHKEKRKGSRKHLKEHKPISPPSSSSIDSDNEEGAGCEEDTRNQEKGPREASAASRKAAGLEWMVQAPSSIFGISENKFENKPLENQPEERAQMLQVNRKELNPFLKDGGDGYPPETSKMEGMERLEVPVIGDGGLSWRLKALKRAKEQAEREGRQLDKIVEERWGSLAEMTTSVSAKRAAHAHAHIHAIRDRKSSGSWKVEKESSERRSGDIEKDKDMEKIHTSNRQYRSNDCNAGTQMKTPWHKDDYSWRRRQPNVSQTMREEDREIFHAAVSALNKYKNDGSFLQQFAQNQQKQGEIANEENAIHLSDRACDQSDDHIEMDRLTTSVDLSTDMLSGLSENQVAAKALQLRLRGNAREADELMNQLQIKQGKPKEFQGQPEFENRERAINHHKGYKESFKSIVSEHKHKVKKGDDGDARLVESILQHKDYNNSTIVDEEYETVSGSILGTNSKKSKRKLSQVAAEEREARDAINSYKRIVTQEERCQFCFNNQSRPKHLTISIANSCYLMLPPWEPLVDGHCLIIPMQHEGASRNVDEDVWEEMRNYKKCLLQMFSKRNRDVIFMETAINLSRQRRHCLVECIPLPPDKAKQAPLYFKKAIDEAEDEWSQHDAKKLIDTSTKGLRGSIPKNFPYFYVEFGLQAGYVHVIDNEREFNVNFGRNVVIGMLKLPEEDMHRKRKLQTFDQQKKTAVNFQEAWDPYDWTKMLDD